MECPDCGAHMRADNLDRHQGSPACKTYECVICKEMCPFLHRKQHKHAHTLDAARQQRGPIIQPEVPVFEIDDEYVEIYNTFSKHIKPQIRTGMYTTVYNFQISRFDVSPISELMMKVFNAQVSTFKIAVSLGYILKNNETDELCYYWPSQNNQLLLGSPQLIRNEADMLGLCNVVSQKDLQKHVTYPNTKYTFVKCTNISFYVTKLPGVAIGAPVDLPEYLLNNRGLYSLTARRGKKYTDRLCFFRALALHRGGKIGAIEVPAKRLLREFCAEASMDVKDFCGISLDQLEDASKLFNVGINVYMQDKDRTTDLVYRTIKQDNIMYLNLYIDHFSYVKDLDKYSRSYCCPKCRKIWTHHGHFKRHVKTCDAGTRDLYANGVFSLPQNIFEQLAVHGVEIPPHLRFYEYRVAFDIECFLSQETNISDTERVSFSHRHELASISICSNVPDFEDPACLISDGSPRKLVKDAIDYMNEISTKASELQHDKFAEYLGEIDELENVALQEKFEEYMSQLPVLSFNGEYYSISQIHTKLNTINLKRNNFTSELIFSIIFISNKIVKHYSEI